MKRILWSLIILCLGLLYSSCKKDQPLSEELLEQIDFISSDTYHETDITEAFGYGSDLNGVWEARFTSGGFAGSGYPLNLDFLLIKPNGIFGIVHDDVLEVYGKIEAENCDRPNSCIDFVSDVVSDDFQNHILGSIHQVRLQNDTLSILTMHADGFDTHFVRVE